MKQNLYSFTLTTRNTISSYLALHKKYETDYDYLTKLNRTNLLRNVPTRNYYIKLNKQYIN